MVDNIEWLLRLEGNTSKHQWVETLSLQPSLLVAKLTRWPPHLSGCVMDGNNEHLKWLQAMTKYQYWRKRETLPNDASDGRPRVKSAASSSPGRGCQLDGRLHPKVVIIITITILATLSSKS